METRFRVYSLNATQLGRGTISRGTRRTSSVHVTVTITIADAAVTCPLTYPLSLPRSWLVRIVIPEGTRSSAVVPCWWRSPTHAASILREESRIRLTNYPRTRGWISRGFFQQVALVRAKNSIPSGSRTPLDLGRPADRNLVSAESRDSKKSSSN